MSRAPALLALVLLAGCYRYVPQRPESIAPGTDVRIHLSADGVRRIGEAYGSASGVLEGRLESWGSDVEVTVPVEAAPGMLDRGLRNRIVVPQADVVGIELRERDATRTAALSVALGGVTALTAIAVFGGVFGGGTEPEDPLPEDVLVPFWLQIF